VDPYSAGMLSPVSFFGRAFLERMFYGVGDLPEIDMVVIHMTTTIISIIDGAAAGARTCHFYTSLGVVRTWNTGGSTREDHGAGLGRNGSGGEGLATLTATPCASFLRKGFPERQTLCRLLY